jgi:hypothetical protein
VTPRTLKHTRTKLLAIGTTRGRPNEVTCAVVTASEKHEVTVPLGSCPSVFICQLRDHH